MRIIHIETAKHILYTALMLSGMALSFGKWIVFSKVLPPTDFGLYTAVMSSVAVSAYIGAMGLSEYLIQRGSSSHGQGQIVEIYELRDNSIFVGLLITTLLLVPACMASFIMDWWGLGLANFTILCAILVSTVLFGIVDASLRAAQRALAFASMVFLRAVLLLFSGYILASWGNFSGILVAELASSTAAILVALYVWGPILRLKKISLNITTFEILIKNGFSFLKLQLLRYTSLMLDKWFVGWSLGSLALGQYSFLLITFLAFTAFAGVYNAVIIPRLISTFNKNNNHSSLAKITRLQALGFLTGSLLLAPLYLSTLNEIISRFFSEYVFPDLLFSLTLIFLGSAFHVASQFFDSFFYATHKQAELTMISALSLILFFACYLAAGNLMEPSVMGFSLAFFLCKLFWFLMTYFRVSQINRVSAATF